jgi:uncharacterized protein (DUF2141 family)
MRFLKTALITSGVLFAGTALHAADLTVTVTGLETPGGTISVGVMDGAEGFPNKRKALTGKRVENAVAGSNSFTIGGLSAGRYAIAGWYDENTNGKFDTNLMGMPNEPYGFSNDARGSFGPPSFEDASFVVGEENLSITFQMAK